jgi:hypothetical protein
MPGPKMGPRPADFDEELIRQAPTYQKWMELKMGEKLRYACRDFIKGRGDDEERLMRRIMIARRNNLKDHEILKQARGERTGNAEEAAVEEDQPSKAKLVSKKRKAATTSSTSDDIILKEMDVAAIEATRSFRAWKALPDGSEFVYNQKYIKGKGNHDWLLRKNIWRRMRYRRENKRLVKKMLKINEDEEETLETAGETNMKEANTAVVSADAAGIVDEALLASAAAAAGEEREHIHNAVVEAAVAAAESYVKGAKIEV